MLLTIHQRYQRPILISETGAEAPSDVGWLGLISSEVRMAIRAGADIRGVCLYPVMDYPGWEDNRHCECGIISLGSRFDTRGVRHDLAAELAIQQQILGSARH